MSPEKSACPGDSKLVELVERSLRGHAIRELEAHLDACASCRRVVAILMRDGTKTDPR